MLAAKLAGTEFRQQLHGPVLRIVALVSVLMVIGSAVIDALRIEATSGFGRGSELIVRVHLVWTLFYLFTAAAFVGEAVTRDRQSGFAPLVRATPVPRAAYLLGRFTGVTAAVLLCFLTVPLGLLAARLLPGANPDWVAPVLPSAFALAFLVLAVPNLLLASALFLALATATRSMNGCLLGAVALLSLYGLSSGPDDVAPILEPFGFLAVQALREGDAAPLIANRACWLFVTLLLVALAVRLDARTPRGARPKRAPSAAAAPPPQHARTPVQQGAQPRFDARTAMLQFAMRVRHHLRETTTAPAFGILLLLGLASCLANPWPEVQERPPLQSLLVALSRSFALVPVVAVLFFAGELHWSDRAHRIDRIVDSTPVPGAVLLLAQITALTGILLLLALASGAAIPLLLAATGQPPEIAAVLTSYVLPKTYDWLLLGVLAWFLQTLSPNKFAGWGYFVLFLIANLGLDQAGLTNPALHYGRYPGAPLPPSLTGEAGAQSFRLLWGAVALVLVAAALTCASRRRSA